MRRDRADDRDANRRHCRASCETRVAPQAGHEQREHDLDDVVERPDEGDRGRARLALAHLDLNLRQPEAAAQRDERRLDLRVVVRVLRREELDPEPVERDEPGRRVGDALPTEQRDEAREDADARSGARTEAR